MTADQVRALLRKKLGKGTQADLAAKLGISRAYLCELLLGTREPGEKVLAALGLKREVGYGPSKARKSA